MAVNLSIDTNSDPLHTQTTSGGNGKFYDGVVVEVEYIDRFGNPVTVYIPAWNWGAGYPAGFSGGSITLDRFYSNVVDARKAMQKKVAKKESEGYSAYGFTRTLMVHSKLRNKIEALVQSSLAVAATAGATPTVLPQKNAPRPGSTTPVTTDKRTAYVRGIEELATTILTCSDLDDAVIKLGKLKSMITDARQELEQAEDAAEMANAYVASRLNR